ncbi:MAG TPA: CHAT domain-containing protein, partial [Anaerolineales bacterium]|nr:CHAT domain-containing protein [Anaerolineales bacterium]
RRIMPTLQPRTVDVSLISPPETIHYPKRGPGSGRVSVSSLTCHFRAEMEQQVILNRSATIELTVSRERIDQIIHAAAVEGQAEVDPKRKLSFRVIPKINFEVLGADIQEDDPPQPGTPKQYYFYVKPAHVGEGEVWVVVRQGQVPLVTLILKPEIVKTAGGAIRRAVSTATTPEAPKLAAPLHQLMIVEQRNGKELTYLFELQSPELQLLKLGTSKPIKGDRAKYVAGLYEEIENRWVSNKEDIENFTQELREIGADMFDQLLPLDLQEALWKYRKRIHSILVLAEEPFIPWELVHIKQPGKGLTKEMCFLGQMGLVRWLHEAGWPKEQLRIQKGRGRYVIPNYPHPDYALPEARQEAAFLEKKFGATAVVPKSSVVRNLLSTPGGFDLLHFAGHGAADSQNIANAQLLLEGRVEGSTYIPDTFSETTVEQNANLSKEGSPPPLVVLNACQAGRAGYKLTGIGGFARAFLRHGAGAFVGTLWSVGDAPARSFTEEFYTRLQKKATIAEAAIAAREAARKAGDATWLAYVVYGHPHARLKTK